MVERTEIMSDLFRREYTKMTAVLCRHFGLKHIEIAEDIVSETFLKATETWKTQDIPENPVAWLYAVARNKTKDYLKHAQVFENQVSPALSRGNNPIEPDFDFTDETITDSQLAMIFAVCNPANPPESQISLALQILCGFSVAEIADAFLAKPETVKKRLLRARANLRNDQFRISPLHPDDVQARLDVVLRTLYLLFNEGYFSKSGNMVIRKDLCAEAMRLALMLAENPLTNTRHVEALLALMCYQSSRFDARLDHDGETVLFEAQDRGLWNSELIDRGNYYLINACSGNTVSKYHIEAGIAYWHTTLSPAKWEHILHLYNQLIIIEYSEMTALNRTFAWARVHGNEAGLAEARKLGLDGNAYYHALVAYLYVPLSRELAGKHYRRAIDLSKSPGEKQTLSREYARLLVSNA
ncbi:sigma-70 family RNA polymerase sigma factor [Dyadobacter sp. 676]|uniref:Sigma-70 family RNA polymerase sigma factor n=1 Tax=Dyadobacter sp. 676 TaxID=3088362 RepID=A0AAU8FMH6_9BACT